MSSAHAFLDSMQLNKGGVALHTLGLANLGRKHTTVSRAQLALLVHTVQVE
jgi:hypothetical protein